MRTPRHLLALAAALALGATPPSRALAGVNDTPLPLFSDGQPAKLAAVVAGVVKHSELETAVLCTNLSPVIIDLGLEVFDQTGLRANTISAGNGAQLAVAPGHTVTISTGATMVLHEDVVIAVEPPVTGLSNGSGRVVATSTQVGCVAFVVDKRHTIEDPIICPTCKTPSLAPLTVTAPGGGAGSTTTSVTSTSTSTSSTSTTQPPCPSAPRLGCQKQAASGRAVLLMK